MSKFLFLVTTEPKEGQEDAYNEWYNNRHIGDVVAVKGFTAAQRFHTASPGGYPGHYLAIYEVEADDPNEALATLRRANLYISDAMDKSKTVTAMFSAISERAITDAR